MRDLVTISWHFNVTFWQNQNLQMEAALRFMHYLTAAWEIVSIEEAFPRYLYFISLKASCWQVTASQWTLFPILYFLFWSELPLALGSTSTTAATIPCRLTMFWRKHYPEFISQKINQILFQLIGTENGEDPMLAAMLQSGESSRLDIFTAAKTG